MQSTHSHPNPTIERLTQYGAAVLLVVMLLAVVAMVALVLRDMRLLLLGLAAVFVLLLALPILMRTTITPALTVSDDGLTITPIIWKPVRVAWDDVRAVKAYPLLPAPGSEVGLKALIGAKRYRAPEGKLLVIPSLPMQYRVNGFFCGEGLTPVIAFTNRTHIDYEALVKTVLDYCEDATP
jgi:hypothetical protein